MATSITFQQIEEQWPLPSILNLADLIEDREQSEALRVLLDTYQDKITDVEQCARILFDHGYLSFDLSWGQTETDVEILLSLPKDVQTTAIKVVHGSRSAWVSFKPFNKPILDAKLWASIDVDESQWTLERRASVSLLKLDLHKQQAQWWTQLFEDAQNPGPPCKDSLSPDRALIYAQTLEMTCKDPKKIFAMYKVAADCGNPVAASRVGNTYIDGDEDAGVKKDQVTALHYIRIAAENGNSECMFQVGHAYQHGIVYEPDFDKAVFWYTQAYETSRHVRAAYFLGHIYHNFSGRQQPDKAAYWWQRAAEQEYPDAMFNLGLYYYNGVDGLSQSKSKALELFQKSTAVNPSYIEMLHQNGIDLEALEQTVAAEQRPQRSETAPRPRRKRSKKSSSWRALNVTAAVVGAAVVVGIVWHNRDTIRLWLGRGISRLQHPEENH